ncbi:hypothetical protein ACO0RG_000060 [Hanseniaspora osmophila]|uniref:Putative ferric reductase transmembrane component n=1 Tax=Hanseniaspora osmophila TaxID=56408 RepID=A0A1E5R5F7_9ASCO|nr:putative ferric reductase transmembrane component [Hanseniaspora osmophila]
MKSFKLYGIIAVLLSALQIAHAAQSFDLSWTRAYKKTLGAACKSTVTGTAMYCTKDSTKSYSCQCNDVVGMGAYVYCGYTESEGDSGSRKHFQDYFISKCPGLTRQEIEDSYNNVTKYITTTSQIKDFNASVPIRIPVKYSEATYKSAYASSYQSNINMDYCIIFGASLIGYWAAIFAVFAIYRALEEMNLSDKYVNNNRVFKFLQSQVIFKSFIGRKHKSPYKFLGYVPVTLDVIFIVGFVVLDIAGCFAGIYDLPASLKSTSSGHHGHGGSGSAKPRLIGIRTGYIANFTINLTFLFAGRNNFLLWCTGWNFQSFITYHKWVSRMTVFNVLAHAIAYYINGSNTARNLALEYYRWGIVAAIAGSAIYLQAYFPLRKYAYEIFLYVHIILALFFLVGSWYHLVRFRLQYYVFASIGAWALDRLLRIVRILNFGGVRKNNVSLINNEYLVLTVKNYNKATFKAKPGNFVFIYFGLWNCFWQSHPFTILSADSEKLKVITSIKKGCTKTVAQYLIKRNLVSMDIPLAFEGPYGTSKERIVNRDQNILMYSTNTGVAGPYHYLKSFIDKGLIQNKSIKFYWCIRNWSSVYALQEELKNLSFQSNINVIVYISQYDEAKLSSESNKSQSETDTLDHEKNNTEEKLTDCSSSNASLTMGSIQTLLPDVEFRAGRMPVYETVASDLDECLENTNVTVMTCGHSDFCDNLRDAVLKNIPKQKTKNVHYIDELQLW